jgi:hypothetical protein
MKYNIINFNYSKINENIKNIEVLPDEIKNKIVINQKIYGLNRNNNYSKYFNNKDLNKLENNIANGINHKSIFEKSEKIIVDGFNCIKLKKNTKIYKYFTGFLDENKIKSLLEQDRYLMYVYFSKYMCYSIIRSFYGGIVVFKITIDIILLDFFDKNNIEKIINKLLNDKPPNYLQIINNIKTHTGFDKTINEQITYLAYKNNIFIYDKIMIPKYNNVYKNIYYDENINPVRIENFDLSYLYSYDMDIFENIIKYLPNINGYIKK